MKIVVPDQGPVRLEDQHVFTEFAVWAPAASGLEDIGGRLAVEAIGSVDDRHAWISPGAVVALAEANGADAAWRAGFEAMSAYAEGRGWCRSDGAIRAHIERCQVLRVRT